MGRKFTLRFLAFGWSSSLPLLLEKSPFKWASSALGLLFFNATISLENVYVCNVCIMLHWLWCLTFVKTLQCLKINNHSVVGRRMETDGCRKEGGGERVGDFYSEAVLAWQLAFVGSAVKADISLLGRVGYKISLPIRSRQIGAWWSVSKREVCLAFKGEKWRY